MTTNKRPWNELGDLEKREAIARRLGYRKNGGTWDSADLLHGYQWKLPNWPTNDELAFAEVWPKLLEVDPTLGLCVSQDFDSIATSTKEVYAWRDGHYMEMGPTWADAICHTAYTLIADPTEAA